MVAFRPAKGLGILGARGHGVESTAPKTYLRPFLAVL